MRPDHTDGTGGGGLLVPMAWLYAEYIADGLLRSGDLMPPTTLEYRAGRDALALTVFLSDGAAADTPPSARADELRRLTACGPAWRGWVRERLDSLAVLAAAQHEAASGDRHGNRGRTGPDLVLARAAWRWLEETELLAADLEAIGPSLGWEASGNRVENVDMDMDMDGEGGRPGTREAQVWTPAWQLGLPLGHLAVHLC
ncbi:hypothetical protein [Streptomyces sp. DT171]|uniref:hypothetical protein n=1 Tax=Streptomyces sp. DT171 TaxID=3416524 RepID=UPI003CE84BC1